MRCNALLFRVALLVLGCSMHTALASDLWQPKSLEQVCQGLRTTDVGALRQALGDYIEVLSAREGIDVTALKLATIDEIGPILRNAVRLHVGPLELFTDVAFTASGPCTLLFDQATLAAIDREYELHALWRIRAPLRDRPEESLDMQWLLLGRGRLVAAYPRAETVRVADYAITYAMTSDAYQYMPYVAADIVNDAGTRGLFKLRTLASARDAEFSSFSGPFSAAVAALALRDRRISASYRLGFSGTAEFAEKPISLR